MDGAVACWRQCHGNVGMNGVFDESPAFDRQENLSPPQNGQVVRDIDDRFSHLLGQLTNCFRAGKKVRNNAQSIGIRQRFEAFGAILEFLFVLHQSRPLTPAERIAQQSNDL
jgi:hypothetical protein